MGYKAEIKRLTNILEVKKKQTDILYAALKKIVMEKGVEEDGEWKLDIPMIDTDAINAEYVIDTEPTENDRLIMHVKKGEEIIVCRSTSQKRFGKIYTDATHHPAVKRALITKRNTRSAECRFWKKAITWWFGLVRRTRSSAHRSDAM